MKWSARTTFEANAISRIAEGKHTPERFATLPRRGVPSRPEGVIGLGLAAGVPRMRRPFWEMPRVQALSFWPGAVLIPVVCPNMSHQYSVHMLAVFRWPGSSSPQL